MRRDGPYIRHVFAHLHLSPEISLKPSYRRVANNNRGGFGQRSSSRVRKELYSLVLVAAYAQRVSKPRGFLRMDNATGAEIRKTPPYVNLQRLRHKLGTLSHPCVGAACLNVLSQRLRVLGSDSLKVPAGVLYGTTDCYSSHAASHDRTAIGTERGGVRGAAGAS